MRGGFKMDFIRKIVVILCMLFVVSWLIVSKRTSMENGDEKNGCQMTYMYRYPSFVRIPLTVNHSAFENYGLYVYHERKQIAEATKLTFTGIPVLFIPGHSGSYRQIRSLASVSQRRSYASVFHFDFFAIDFGDEYSHVFGWRLHLQTRFAELCINRILSLYKGHRAPKHVIIIGHSLGGIIPLGLLANSKFNKDSVRLVITLATPHSPIILPDFSFVEYYDAIGRIEDEGMPENFTLISITGGMNDVVVPAQLTMSTLADLNVMTPSIPSVGSSADHLSIMWCKSLIKVLTRCLYDAVDIESRGLVEDKNTLLKVFQLHLLQGHAGAYRCLSSEPELSPFHGNWEIVSVGRFSSFTYTDNEELTTFFDLIEKQHFDAIAIRTFNMMPINWLGVCKMIREPESNTTLCSKMKNISNMTLSGFNEDYGKKYADINIQNLIRDGWTHIFIHFPGTDDPITVNVEFYKWEDRYITQKRELESTASGALFYKMEFRESPVPWNINDVYITPQCPDNVDNDTAFAMAYNPEVGDMLSFAVIRSSDENPKLRVFMRDGPILKKGTTELQYEKLVHVSLFLDTRCTYSVNIQNNNLDSISYTFLTRFVYMYSHVVSVTLCMLGWQVALWYFYEYVPPLTEIVGFAAFACYCQTQLLCYFNIQQYLRDGTFSTYLPPQLPNDSMAYITCHQLAIAVAIVVLLDEALYATLLITARFWKYVNSLVNMMMDEWIVDSTVTFCVCCYVFGYCTCPGLVYLCVTPYYFHCLSEMYERKVCLKEDIKEIKSEDKKKCYKDALLHAKCRFRVHRTLFILWLACSFIYITNVYSWMQIKDAVDALGGQQELDFRGNVLFVDVLFGLAGLICLLSMSKQEEIKVMKTLLIPIVCFALSSLSIAMTQLRIFYISSNVMCLFVFIGSGFIVTKLCTTPELDEILVNLGGLAYKLF